MSLAAKDARIHAKQANSLWSSFSSGPWESASRVRHVWPAHDMSALPALTSFGVSRSKSQVNIKELPRPEITARSHNIPTLRGTANPGYAALPVTPHWSQATSHYGTIGTITAEGCALS